MWREEVIDGVVRIGLVGVCVGRRSLTGWSGWVLQGRVLGRSYARVTLRGLRRMGLTGPGRLGPSPGVLVGPPAEGRPKISHLSIYCGSSLRNNYNNRSNDTVNEDHDYNDNH